MREPNFDIQNNPRMVIIVQRCSRKCNLVRIVSNTHYSVFFFIRKTQNEVNNNHSSS